MPGIHAPQSKQTVLVAEGDALLREQLSTTLEQNGYHVITVRNGEEAVIVLERSAGEIDIVYAAVDLPRRSGLDVFLKVKSVKPGIRFVLASEPLGEKTRESLFRIGVRAILETPFLPEALVKCLQTETADVPWRGANLNKQPTEAMIEQAYAPPMPVKRGLLD